MNLVARQNFGRKSSPAYNTEIGGVSGTITTASALATKLGISVGNISNFTIVGSDIKCRITGSYGIPNSAFQFNATPCTYYKDIDYLVTSIGEQAFYATSAFTGYDADFQNCLSVGNGAFNSNSNGGAKKYLFKNLTTAGSSAFSSNLNTEIIYIPNCTNLGGTSGNNNVFLNLASSCKIYANPSLATNNGGSPDGDLTGRIVSYVTNFTAPLQPTSSAIGTIYNTAIQLIDPATSTNAIDYYEVSINSGAAIKVNSGSYITGLTPSTSYTFTLIAIDIFYNKSVVSNSLSVSTNTTSAVPTTGLVSYYKLDINSNDSYGSNNGTSTSISYVSGKVSNASSFNGSSSKIIVGNPANLQLSTGSISCWIKTSGAGSSYRSIFGKTLAYNMFLLDNVLIVYNWSSYGGTGVKNTSVNLADNAWHHIVFVFESSTALNYLYIDGVLKLTFSWAVSNQTDNFCIGSSNSVQYFNGLIDEGAVYNTKLTQSQIDLLYNSGNGITL